MSSLQKFVLGIPNPGSSLFDSTVQLFNKIGVQVAYNGRAFEGEIEGVDIFGKACLMRPQDIPNAISKGTLDCGICGWDCVVESGLENKLVKISELNYGKKLTKPVRIVAFSRKFSTLKENESITVTTEYPNITRAAFKNIPQENIDFSYGTTEAKVAAGMYDYGVCVTEGGKSLIDNNLQIVRVLLVSPTVFMAKLEAPELESFGKMLEGALLAKKLQLITMNADASVKDEILSILPALKSPTVSRLEDGGYSISTVVETKDVANLLLKLRQLGAAGIIGTDINFAIK
ncbi:MAG: ATP phosphoribosyltransferase [Parcubacteria group bacterium]